jgi:hypothetical protein
VQFADSVDGYVAGVVQAQLDTSQALLAAHLEKLRCLHEEQTKIEAAKVDQAPLVALASLLSGGKLVIFSGPLPENYASEPAGFCLAEIELPSPAFKATGMTLAISEPPWVGWGLPAAGRGRLARSFFFVDRDGEVVARGTCGAPEDGDADLRLDRPAIAAGRKVVLAEFNFHMTDEN